LKKQVMEKTRIDVDPFITRIPDEQDLCVKRIITALEKMKGIEKVHVIHGGVNEEAKLVSVTAAQ
jgi:hypothetical protein